MNEKTIFSIFTMSYNKPRYVAETIESVLRQTFINFEYWIIENSTDKETRNIVKKYVRNDKRIKYVERNYSYIKNRIVVPAMILNEFFPKAKGRYILAISDDDIFSSNLLQVIYDFMQKNPCNAAYFKAKAQVLLPNGIFEDVNEYPVTGIRTHGNLDCSVDGEQTVITKSILDKLKKPYFNETVNEANHIDGIFMERIAELTDFQPIENGEFLLIKRRTPVSTFTKP